MTAQLPAFLREYVLGLSVEGRSAAYLLLDADERVREAGGELARYGLAGARAGDEVAERAAFLAGMLPPGGEALELPALEVRPGRFADVHIGPVGPASAGGSFVLLLDATEAVERESALQQKGNDFDLLRERAGAGRTPAPEDVASGVRTGLSQVSVVRVRIAPATLPADGAAADDDAELVAEVRRCRRLVREALRRQSGLLDDGAGGELGAVYGVLESTGLPARLALNAARAVCAVAERVPRLTLGVGVASGAARVFDEGGRPLVLGEVCARAGELALHAELGRPEVDTATAAADPQGVVAAGARRSRVEAAEHADLSGMLLALGVVVLERVEGERLVLTDDLPGWMNTLFDREPDGGEGLVVADELSFLANFLVDARDFWEAGRTGYVRSGIWTQDGPDGDESAFEAVALVGAAGRRLLAVELLSQTYEERRELLQLAHETSLSFETLRAEIQKKDVLLHCIVHDLKAPLSGIVGALSLLSTRELAPDKVRSLLDLGLRQARRQEELIRQVLEVFEAEIDALEAFELDPARAPDLVAAAREAVESFQPAFTERGVELVVEATARAPATVVGHADGLARVLGNLLENALRYAPAGTRVDVDAADEGPSVIIMRVLDRGPGVEPEVAEKLFERFVRGTGGTTGLGLFYCRIAVKSWGGSVRYTPRDGGGAVFEVRLQRLA